MKKKNSCPPLHTISGAAIYNYSKFGIFGKFGKKPIQCFVCPVLNYNVTANQLIKQFEFAMSLNQTIIFKLQA